MRAKVSAGLLMRRAGLLAAVLALAACHDSSDGGATQTTPAAQYSVVVTVSGLNGTGLVLQNNGAGDLPVAANGNATFAATQLSGTPYAVTVFAQPAGPAQTCSVANGSGTVGSANVTNVTVTCTNNYVPTYTPSAPGDPVGTATTQMIDSAGGSATSPDGRLTVTIPAGALAAATTISIQPITNTAPNGLGLAYSLEPEGTTFAAPVTLSFSLSPTEAAAIDSTFAATQHADGLWYSLPNQARDTNAQTVAVNTTHFSGYGLVETLLLTPHAPRVRTGGTVTFTATIVVVNPTENPLANPLGDMAIPDAATLAQLPSPRTWDVNHVVGGNATVGLIADPGVFTAPSTVPTPNIVTVEVTAQLGDGKAIALEPVEIFAQELWTGTTDITQIDGTKVHANVTFVSKDNSNFNPPTKIDFVVQSGTVHVTIPPTNSAGCSQSVSPDHFNIATNDGSMSVTYDTNFASAQVVGGGTTVWAATLTVVCANGTQVVDVAQAAPWWPINAANPLQSYPALNGFLEATVGDPSASGIVQLGRQ